jgi:hypothetical protein
LCWVFKRYRIDWRAALGVVVTLAVSIALMTPVITHYLQFNRAIGYHHPEHMLASLSLEVAAPLRVPDWLAFWSWSPLVRVSDFKSALTFTSAWPGLGALVLAMYALVQGIRDTRWKRTVLLLLALAVAFYLFALGPILKPINFNEMPGTGWLPMPGKIFLLIPGIRWPMRIFFFALLAFAVLSGLGLQFVRQKVAPRWRNAIVFGAIALIMIESWPRLWFVQKSAAAADPMALSDAYPFLASEPDRGGVVELPVADRSGWRTLYLTRYTYASAAHQRRIVAIHGGVRPAVTDSLLNAAVYAPDSTAMRLLSSHGVTRLVIHLPLMTGGKGPWMVKRLQHAGYPVVFAGHEAVVFSTTR